MSKGRTWAIVTILVVVVVAVAMGLGLDLGLRKPCDEHEKTSPGNPSSTPQSQLSVAPSVSVEGHYRFAAVAADAPECATIGTRIMAVDGGSAMDAAIAAISCACIYNAHSCGIGGGHFITYYNRMSGEATAINAREQAPSAATADMFAEGRNTSSTEGGKSIGIPGEVRGLYEAHKLGGRLPWARLFEPAIRLCRDGVPVGKTLHRVMALREKYGEDFPNFKEFLTNPESGQLYKLGEIMKQPKLARTLEIIAQEGPDAFYNGSLSRNIIDDIAEAGGIITEEDLANYSTLVTPALKLKLHPSYTAFSPPPPSSGPVYLSILNILNGYNLTAASVSSVDEAVLTFHRTVEAFKHALSQRTQLGDYNVGSDSFKKYIHELVTNMTSGDFGEEIRRKIDDARTFDSEYYDPKFYNTWDQGTAHLSVLGPNGDAVSISSTLDQAFGSHVVGSRTGILFNDEMADFSTPSTKNTLSASPANFIEPWKRPMSSMCPSVVVGPDGDVELVIGASGAAKIVTATTLVTMETLWFDWSIKKAIDYPRVHHELLPNVLFIEPETPQVLIDRLKQKGHKIRMETPYRSVVQGIRQKGGQITANSDIRKDGVPDGF